MVCNSKRLIVLLFPVVTCLCNGQLANGQFRDEVRLEELGAKLLVDSGFRSSWSPDAKQLAFGKPEGKGIYVLDIKSRKKTKLTDVGKDPVWSPDGAHIAYVVEPHYNEYFHETVWLINSKGGKPTKLVAGTFPSWSTDGKSVTCFSHEHKTLVSVKIGDMLGNVEKFPHKPEQWYCDLSPDGKLVTWGADEQLVVADRETGKRIATWDVKGQRGLLPAWSPDGRRIAFGGFDGSRFGLWIYDLKSRSATQVVQGCDTMPAWSQDGKWLSFDYRPRVDSIREIWAIEVERLASGD